jgi:hypothetical protein
MIQNEVTKFMALAPLIMPKLFNVKDCQEVDISEDNAVIHFPFEEKQPLSLIMDELSDEPELLFLFHGTNKLNQKVRHCCYFSKPYKTTCMFKLNLVTDSIGETEGITVTVFNEVDVMETSLEDDLHVHATSFDFLDAMRRSDVVSLFCKFQ